MTGLKVIILDFDGVLIESNHVKDRVFETVFAAHPRHLSQIMSYHRATTAIRFEKFRHIYQAILKEPYPPQEATRLAAEFSRLSVEGSIACPWVKGAEVFLKEFAGRVPMYLASINPPADLDAVLQGRHIGSFFKGVFTASASKAGILQEILRAEGAGGREAVFVGDTRSDHASALEAGVPFVGRQAQSDLSGTGAPVFEDMNGVREYLSGCYGRR